MESNTHKIGRYLVNQIFDFLFKNVKEYKLESKTYDLNTLNVNQISWRRHGDGTRGSKVLSHS